MGHRFFPSELVDIKMALNDAIENDNSSEIKTDNENVSEFAMDCGRDAGGNQSLEPRRDNLQSPESSERTYIT